MTENISHIGVLLQILQIVAIIGGGIFALATLRTTVGAIKTDVVDMKIELKKLGDIVVTLAVTSKRLDNVEDDIREMKRGRGFVQARINGEYP